MILEFISIIGLGVGVKRIHTLMKRLDLAKWYDENYGFYNRASDWILSEIAQKGAARVVNVRGEAVVIQDFKVVGENEISTLTKEQRKGLKKCISTLEDCRPFLEKKIGA